SSPPFHRVAYGLAELREKLIVQDAGINDARLEMLKIWLISAHPVLLNTPRLRLLLSDVTDRVLKFVAIYDHDPRRHQILVKRSFVEEFVGSAFHSKNNPFLPSDGNWVNLWKLNPSNEALRLLK